MQNLTRRTDGRQKAEGGRQKAVDQDHHSFVDDLDEPPSAFRLPTLGSVKSQPELIVERHNLSFPARE
jgi:hypothetical protein